MHEVLLNQSERKPIVTFHANTLEFFSTMSKEGGSSFHVGHLKSVEITTDKKGKHWLVVKLPVQAIETEVSEEALSKAKELVAAVQDAMKMLKI